MLVFFCQKMAVIPQNNMVAECKPERNREAITVFSRLPSLMATDGTFLTKNIKNIKITINQYYLSFYYTKTSLFLPVHTPKCILYLMPTLLSINNFGCYAFMRFKRGLHKNSGGIFLL